MIMITVVMMIMMVISLTTMMMVIMIATVMTIMKMMTEIVTIAIIVMIIICLLNSLITAKISTVHTPSPLIPHRLPSQPKQLSQHIIYATNGTSCTVNTISLNVTLRHGIDGENSKLLGEASTMEKCIEMSCNNIEGNTAFLLGKRCYVVQCPGEKLCNTIPLKRKGVSSEMAHLQRPRSHLDYKGRG